MSTPVSIVYPGLIGAQTDFSFPFHYLSKGFVKATLDGAPAPFEWISQFTIQIDPAPSGELRIYRETPRDELINFYNDGSILIDDDLNTSFYQSLMVSEEVADGALSKGAGGHWDANGLRVVNVGPAVNPGDLVSKDWAETAMSSQLSQATSAKGAAESARDAALAHRNAASTSASTASTKATEASNSAAAALDDKNTVAADKATVNADKLTVAADKGTVAADKSTVAGDRATAVSAKNTAVDAATTATTAAGTAVSAKNAAEAARDVALGAASALLAVRVDGSGGIEFVVNGVVLAKLTAAGTFLTKGDIGINQSF